MNELQATIWAEPVVDGYAWEMLVGPPGSPYPCRIQSITWRRYKSPAAAIAAARRTAKRLGVKATKLLQ